jgi:riboflavin kinase / FMN adenylyltransferase
VLEVIDLTQRTEIRGASCALGNFDGLHLGHKQVLHAARVSGYPFSLMTFSPHPRQYFKTHTQPFRLTPLSCQIRIAKELGVERVYVVPFDASLVKMSPDEFVRQILVERAGVLRLAVGENFRFGANRAGDVAVLKSLATPYGIDVTKVPLQSLSGEIVSSSSVREALESGRPEKAAQLLGRWFEISGTVEHGDKRGRDLGYPTLNIDLGEYMCPKFGVYAVRVCINEIWYDGVASLGIRPMFKLDRPLLEVHVFNFNQTVYGSDVRVSLRKWLRSELKFDSITDLKTQMDRDSKEALQFLAVQKNPWEGMVQYA